MTFTTVLITARRGAEFLPCAANRIDRATGSLRSRASHPASSAVAPNAADSHPGLPQRDGYQRRRPIGDLETADQSVHPHVAQQNGGSRVDQETSQRSPLRGCLCSRYPHQANARSRAQALHPRALRGFGGSCPPSCPPADERSRPKLTPNSLRRAIFAASQRTAPFLSPSQAKALVSIVLVDL